MLRFLGVVVKSKYAKVVKQGGAAMEGGLLEELVIELLVVLTVVAMVKVVPTLLMMGLLP